ncbi:hypothetical protein MferCBS31731_002385 [Microsporum ferrugineum]
MSLLRATGQPYHLSGALHPEVSPYLSVQHRQQASLPPPRCRTRSDAVKTDHRELEHYYQVIVNSTDPAEKTKYQNAKEHQILKVFHDTDADPKFMGLSDHIREEESVGLVKIEHLLDLTESDRMAASEQTKMFVPARSRLSAPTNRPLRLL